jgi:hypothetical protein
MRGMKAYIYEYEDNVNDHSVLDVWFHSTPAYHWNLYSLADIYCSVFNESGIRVGEHRCSFQVENLKDGTFAIACARHPGLLAARGNSRLLGSRAHSRTATMPGSAARQGDISTITDKPAQ